jgi:hypothetical protein
LTIVKLSEGMVGQAPLLLVAIGLNRRSTFRRKPSIATRLAAKALAGHSGPEVIAASFAFRH